MSRTKAYARKRKGKNPDKLSPSERKTKVNLKHAPTTTESSGKNAPGRPYTVTVALPGSVVSNAQSPELKSYLAGQIARALTIFNIDEVVVFSEDGKILDHDDHNNEDPPRSDPNVFLARILQYLETPQYLRKSLFAVHPDLKYAGLLNPLDAPHHLRIDNVSAPYREGVTLSHPLEEGEGSLVNIGLGQDVRIDHPLEPNVRVTVRLDSHEADASTEKPLQGYAVAASEPRERLGTYWGYTTRLAAGMSDVLTGGPFKDGYDLTIGISTKHGKRAQKKGFFLKKFKHLLVVLGGTDCLKSCLAADEKLAGSTPANLFDHVVNVCPQAGSAAIRTEEEMLIALSVLHKHILSNKVKF